MGFRFVVMFIGYFMDDVTYVRDVEVCMQSMMCYIPGCVCCGSENFGLGSLCDYYVGLAGTTPEFHLLLCLKRKRQMGYRCTTFIFK